MQEITSNLSSRAEISKRLVLINSASSLLTRLLSVSVLIWLQQYLLMRITPEEYSLLPVLNSVMMFAPLITTILTSGLGRYVVEAYAKDDDERVTQIVSTMFPILCAAGLIFLAGGWTFAWHIDKILSIDPDRLWDARIMMALLMFTAAIRLPLSPFAMGFFVRQKFVLLNLIGVGMEIFRLSILFTLLFGIGTRVLWVVTASVCSGILGQTINLIISRRLVPALRFRPSHIHWPIARELTSFGGWAFVGRLADTIRTSADAIILNKLATPVDLTCYHIGAMPQRQMHAFSVTISGPLAPALIAIHASGDKKRLRQLYVRGGRLGLWAFLFVAVPLIIFSDHIVTLYVGPAYADASAILALLVAQGILYYGNHLYGMIANAKGKIRLLSLGLALQNAINLGLTLYLVGSYGMGGVGAALATFITVSLFQIFLFWPAAMRMLQLRFGKWVSETLIPGLSPCIASSVIWLPISRNLAPTSWSILFLAWLSGALVYVVVFFAIARRLENFDGMLNLRGLLQRFRKQSLQ